MEKTLRELTEQLTERDSQLKESEKLFRTVFCINPLPMSITTLEGRFIKVNRALCHISGWEEEELLGKKPEEFGLYVDADQRNHIVAILASGMKVDNYYVVYRIKDGTTINALLTAKAVKIDGQDFILAAFMPVERTAT